MEAYLRENIPLTGAMDVQVLSASPERVVLEAPLEPNLNHRDTAFGGSVAALAILAGWTLVHARVDAEGIEGTSTVIQKSEINYVAPADGPFRASCVAPEPEAWARFRRMLERKGKGRVAVTVELTCRGVLVGTFQGAYVTLDDAHHL